jgi:hypothetical protein
MFRNMVNRRDRTSAKSYSARRAGGGVNSEAASRAVGAAACPG